MTMKCNLDKPLSLINEARCRYSIRTFSYVRITLLEKFFHNYIIKIIYFIIINYFVCVVRIRLISQNIF